MIVKLLKGIAKGAKAISKVQRASREPTNECYTCRKPVHPSQKYCDGCSAKIQNKQGQAYSSNNRLSSCH